MKQLTLIAVLLGIVLCQNITGHGISVVGPLTTSAFACLAQQGIRFALVRAYTIFDTYADIDPHAIRTLNNSQNGGVPTDIYIVLCRNNSDPT